MPPPLRNESSVGGSYGCAPREKGEAVGARAQVSDRPRLALFLALALARDARRETRAPHLCPVVVGRLLGARPGVEAAGPRHAGPVRLRLVRVDVMPGLLLEPALVVVLAALLLGAAAPYPRVASPCLALRLLIMCRARRAAGRGAVLLVVRPPADDRAGHLGVLAAVARIGGQSSEGVVQKRAVGRGSGPCARVARSQQLHIVRIGGRARARGAARVTGDAVVLCDEQVADGLDLAAPRSGGGERVAVHVPRRREHRGHKRVRHHE